MPRYKVEATQQEANKMTKNQWNIQALETAHQDDLSLCNSASEIINANALHGKEVRKLAASLDAQGKLSPAARAIAEKYGYAS